MPCAFTLPDSGVPRNARTLREVKSATGRRFLRGHECPDHPASCEYVPVHGVQVASADERLSLVVRLSNPWMLPAQVTVRYLRDRGAPVVKTVPPTTRYTSLLAADARPRLRRSRCECPKVNRVTLGRQIESPYCRRKGAKAGAKHRVARLERWSQAS